MRFLGKRMSWLMLVTLLMAGFLLTVACGDDDDDDDSTDVGSGTLEFYANGEEFIREGFPDKTSWNLLFSHFYVTLQGPTAYQVADDDDADAEKCALKHAGHPHEDIAEGSAHEALLGDYWLDLAEGSDRQLVGEVTDAPAGNYNYGAFSMVQADEGDFAGYSIIMVGMATKMDTDETIDFTIKLTEEMTFSSCHQEVDESYAGVVEDGGVGSMEMTFHSDHLFGDHDDLGNPEGVNPGALGFQAFADLAVDGVLDIDQAQMEQQMTADDYATFLAALYTLGHSGEGHCNYSAYVEE